jgi:hypothetical protein
MSHGLEQSGSRGKVSMSPLSLQTRRTSIITLLHDAGHPSPILATSVLGLLAGAEASTAFEGLIGTMIRSNTAGQEISEGFEQDLHRLPSTMGN